MGRHFFEHICRFFRRQGLNDIYLRLILKFFHYVSSLFFIHAGNYIDLRFSVHVFYDIRQIRWMEGVEFGIGAGQSYSGPHGIDRFNLVPQDEIAGQGNVKPAQESLYQMRDPEPPEESFKAYVHRYDIYSAGNNNKPYIIYPYQLPAVDVDQLLVKDTLGQENRM